MVGEDRSHWVSGHLPEIFHSQDAGFDEDSPPELLKAALYETVRLQNFHLQRATSSYHCLGTSVSHNGPDRRQGNCSGVC